MAHVSLYHKLCRLMNIYTWFDVIDFSDVRLFICQQIEDKVTEYDSNAYHHTYMFGIPW